MNDIMAIAIGLVGAVCIAAVLMILVLVVLDRWTARSTWKG